MENSAQAAAKPTSAVQSKPAASKKSVAPAPVVAPAANGPLGALYSAGPALGLAAAVPHDVLVVPPEDPFERDVDVLADPPAAGSPAMPPAQVPSNEASAPVLAEQRQEEEDEEPVQMLVVSGREEDGPGPAPVLAAPWQEEVEEPAPEEPTQEAESPAASSPAAAAPMTGPATLVPLLVEDDTTDLAPGQLRKGDFLNQLEEAVSAAAEAALAGSAWTADQCPYIGYWFTYYRARQVDQVERALHRYAPDTRGAAGARDYIAPLVARVRQGIEQWRATGELTGVPDGVPLDLPGAPRADQLVAEERATPIARQSQPGSDAPVVARAQAIQSRLGQGQPLEGRTKARMESAFSANLSHVRVHTNGNAAQQASSLQARAFTVGRDIAFGPGEYRPGTPLGDALIAHELTHVMQQTGGGSTRDPAVGPSYESMEADASRSALGVIAGLWQGARQRFSGIVQQVGPQLRSGLRLQRCGFMVPGLLESVVDEIFTVDGDSFGVSAYLQQTYKGNTKTDEATIEVVVTYAGEEDSLPSKSRGVAFLFKAPLQYTNPTVTRETRKETVDGHEQEVTHLLVDVFGDGTYKLDVSHYMIPVMSHEPPIRSHTFCADVTGEKAIGARCHDIDVKDWLARPVGEKATAGEELAPPIPTGGSAQPVALATSALLEIALVRLKEVQPHTSKIDPLVELVQGDLASPAGSRDEASLRVAAERLNDLLVAVGPVFPSLTALGKPANYLPGIAAKISDEAAAIKEHYSTALLAAYKGTDAEGKTLAVAERAMMRFPDFIASLYLSDEGIPQIFNQIRDLREDILRLRSKTKRAILTRPADSMVGMGNASTDPIEADFNRALTSARRARFYRSQDVQDTVTKLTLVSQSVAAVMTALAYYEQFKHWEMELDDSIINAVIEIGAKSQLDQARLYLGKLDAILTTLEGYSTAKTPKEAEAALSKGISDLQALISSPDFTKAIEEIRSRLSTIDTIDILGKMVVITAISALTGGAAATAATGLLRGLAVSATAVRTGAFVAEVLAFTVTSQVGQQLAFGKTDQSFGEALIWNAAMFGVLKAATSKFETIFARFADPKVSTTALALGKAGTAVVSLHAFAEVQHLLTKGTLMTGEERGMALLQNVVMVVALEAGRFMSKPLAARLEAPINSKLKADFKAEYEAVEADRKALLEQLQKAERGSASKDEVEALLRNIEALWTKELKLISDGATKNLLTQAEAEAAVAPHKAQLSLLELRLAQLGFSSPLRAGTPAFRPLARGVVAFTPEGKAALESFYGKDNLKQSSVADMLEGRSPQGELTFYVPEGVTPRDLPSLERITTARDVARMEAASDPLAKQGMKQLESFFGNRKLDEILASAKPEDVPLLLRALADPAYNMQLGGAFYSGLAAHPEAITFSRTYGGDVLARMYRTYGSRWSPTLEDAIARATTRLETAASATERTELLDKLRTTTDATKLDVLLGKPVAPPPPPPVRATKANMGVDRSRASWKAFRVEVEKVALAHGETLTSDKLDLRADLEQVIDAARSGRLDALGHDSRISVLDRFDQLAQQSSMMQTWINAKRGNLSEYLFNPQRGRKKASFLSGSEVAWGTKGATVPDYFIDQGAYREWVNQKSDLIDSGPKTAGVYASGRAAARTYRLNANLEAGNLPAGAKYSLDFVRDPGPETRKAMLAILLDTGSPIHRVKFGEVWYP